MFRPIAFNTYTPKSMKTILFAFLFLTAPVSFLRAQETSAPAIPAHEATGIASAGGEQQSGSITTFPATPASETAADGLSVGATPNPFISKALITCTLPDKGKLTLGIRNMFGESVKLYEAAVPEAGNWTANLSSESLKPGLYAVTVVFRTADRVMVKTVRIICTN
jgi:hypothetical protein